MMPIREKIVVRPDAPVTQTEGGLYLQKDAQTGVVVAAGPGRMLDNGTLVMLSVKAGDRVLYSKYGGTEVQVPGEDGRLLVMDEASVFLVL